MPGPARHVEIWNRGWAGSHNEMALKQYYNWLNEGFRIVASSGTDTHRPMPSGIRIAANRIHAMDNTPDEILAGLRRGHCFVTSGPEITLLAELADGTSIGMGDLAAPGSLKISCGWSYGLNGFDPGELEAILIRNAQITSRWSCADRDGADFATHTDEGDWFALELRDRNGELHVLSNPVFVGQKNGIWR